MAAHVPSSGCSCRQGTYARFRLSLSMVLFLLSSAILVAGQRNFQSNHHTAAPQMSEQQAPHRDQRPVPLDRHHPVSLPSTPSRSRRASSVPMAKVVLSTSVGTTGTMMGTTGPQCADGTPYAFYTRAPSATGAPTIVFLNGGGACLTSSDCANRKGAYPDFFTSSLLVSQTTGYDLLSPDPKANPSFYTAGHVFLPYCSQDLWAGGGTSGANLSSSSSIVFAGLANLAAVWDYLALSNTTVLLGGSSAGGVGAARFAALLSDVGLIGARGLRLRLLMDSAWFVDYRASLSTQLAAMPVPVLQWWGVPSLSLCSVYLASNMSCCVDPVCMADHILTNSSSQVSDVFVTESLYDPYVLAIWLANQLATTVSTVTNINSAEVIGQIDLSLGVYSTSTERSNKPVLVTNSLSSVEIAVALLALLEQYSGFLLESLSRYATNQRLRFFAPACIQHVWLRPERPDADVHQSSGLVLTVAQGTWAVAAVGSCTLQQAIGGWWTGGNSSSGTFGSQCTTSLTSTCAGAGCEQSCGVRFHGATGNSWESTTARATLVLVIAVLMFISCMWLSLLLVASFVRWKIAWPGVFNPNSDQAPRLAKAISMDMKTNSSLPSVPHSMRMTISALNMSYSVGHRSTHPILSDVSFQFASNSLIGIIGSSGCGKTTLLDLLANRRQYGQRDGTLSLNGVDMATCDGLAVRKKIAYVRQFGGCYFEHLTVFDNMMYAALLRLPGTMTLQQRKDIVMGILEEVELAHRAQYLVGSDDSYVAGGPSISGGQKRRLAIALELLTEPVMLVMDEPTSGLDSASCLSLLSWLRAYCDTGRTVVMSIHQPRAEVFSKFDNLLVMHRGHVVIYKEPAVVVERFLWHARQLDAEPLATSNVADMVMDILNNTIVDVAQHVRAEYEDSPAHAQLMQGLLAQRRKSGDSHARQSTLRRESFHTFGEKPGDLPCLVAFWAAVKLALLKAVAQVDRQSRGMMFSVLAMCLQNFGFALVFGFLYRNAEQGYVFASALVCLQTAIVPCMFVFATPKLQLHLAAFRKDSDCGAVSGSLFCLSTLLVYLSLFVLPSVTSYVLTFYLVLGDNSSLIRLATLGSISLALSTTGLTMLLCAGGLTHVLQLNASQSNGVIASAGIGFWSFFGIMSSFYIAEPLTPIYMRWLYYISPQFYFFSSAARVMMEGLPVVCSSNLLGGIISCVVLSPVGFLEDRFYTNVDVARHVGMQMVLWLFYFSVFLAMMAVVDWRGMARRAWQVLSQAWHRSHRTQPVSAAPPRRSVPSTAKHYVPQDSELELKPAVWGPGDSAGQAPTVLDLGASNGYGEEQRQSLRRGSVVRPGDE